MVLFFETNGVSQTVCRCSSYLHIPVTHNHEIAKYPTRPQSTDDNFQALKTRHPLHLCYTTVPPTNPLDSGQPQSLTILPVANWHPQPHTMHPVPIYSRQRKCKTLNLKINGRHSSGMSYNKFLFNDFSFHLPNYNSLVSVRNAFFNSLSLSLSVKTTLTVRLVCM